MNQWRVIVEVSRQLPVRLQADSEADVEQQIYATLADEVRDADMTMRIASMEKLDIED